YQRLDYAERSTKDELQQMVLDYILDLTDSYLQPSESFDTWKNLMDADLLEVLQDAWAGLQEMLPFEMQKTQLHVIGLHLQNYRKHLLEQMEREPSPVIIHHKPIYRKAAAELELRLRVGIALDFPEEEVELIAHFFKPEKEVRQGLNIEPKRPVLLVTHGN